MTSRRNFIFHVIPAASVALVTSRIASAEAVKVAETDPAALGLGYKHDASKVDTKKYPGYAAGHNCANCQLYMGKAGDSWGACGAMGGKLVNAKGWCVVWAKKA
jgi:hypothetical protein